MTIGDNVFIGHFCVLDGTGNLEIEEGCQIAGWSGIYTHSSHISIRLYGAHYQDIPEADKEGFFVLPVHLGKYVFVGAGAMIFPGVTVGKGALIHANTIVSRDVDEFSVVAGNPAQVVGDSRQLDQKYLDNDQLRQWYEEWQK